MEKRLEWIDIARGIAIILVVFGHAEPHIPETILKYIYSFHMPLFFFLSGFLFFESKYKTFSQFAKKKIMGLVVPYFIFCIITYLYWFFIESKITHDPVHQNPLFSIFGMFYSSVGYRFMHFDIPMWFLTGLFSLEILFYIYRKKFKTQTKLVSAVLITGLIGYIYSLFQPIRLPWSFDVVLTAIMFYCAGYFYQKLIHHESRFPKYSKLFILTVFGLVGYLFSQVNSKVDMSLLQYGNPILFYVSAFSGIIAVIMVSKAIAKSRTLSYMGTNSLIIMALHLKVPVSLIFEKIENYDIDAFDGTTIYGIIYSVISIGLCIPAIYLINNYMPFILGKSRKTIPKINIQEERAMPEV